MTPGERLSALERAVAEAAGAVEQARGKGPRELAAALTAQAAALKALGDDGPALREAIAAGERAAAERQIRAARAAIAEVAARVRDAQAAFARVRDALQATEPPIRAAGAAAQAVGAAVATLRRSGTGEQLARDLADELGARLAAIDAARQIADEVATVIRDRWARLGDAGNVFATLQVKVVQEPSTPAMEIGPPVVIVREGTEPGTAAPVAQ